MWSYIHTNSQNYGYINFKSLQAAARAATAARRGEFVGDNMYYDGQHLVDPELNKLLDPSTFIGVPMTKPSEGIDVYVHNLNVFVSDNDLRNQFSSYGDISFCEVEISLWFCLIYSPSSSFQYTTTLIDVLGSRSHVNLILAMVLDVLHFQPTMKLTELLLACRAESFAAVEFRLLLEEEEEKDLLQRSWSRNVWVNVMKKIISPSSITKKSRPTIILNVVKKKNDRDQVSDAGVIGRNNIFRPACCLHQSWHT